MRTNALKKSYISNERVLALDELLPERNNDYDSSPGVYVRTDRDRELDILWQGTRVNVREEKSPVFYLSAGFVAGIVCVFMIFSFLNLGKSSESSSSMVSSYTPSAGSVNVPGDEASEVPVKAPATKTKDSSAKFSWWKPKLGKSTAVSVSPSFKDEQQPMTDYTVKSGDTLEAIAYRFYGMGGPIRVAKIQTANNMKSPDQLQIGQKLVIPVEN